MDRLISHSLTTLWLQAQQLLAHKFTRQSKKLPPTYRPLICKRNCLPNPSTNYCPAESANTRVTRFFIHHSRTISGHSFRTISATLPSPPRTFPHGKFTRTFPCHLR